MADSVGPPTGVLKHMTPYSIANDPPAPKPIPDIPYPDKTPAERSVQRFSLAAKHAIVTGGAQGLGLVCARALLEHGATALAIFDVNSEQLEAALQHHKSISPADINIVVRKVDVSNDAAVHLAVKEVNKAFEGIGILLCFAGITGSELPIDYDIERWRKIVDVNLNGPFIAARNVTRQMIEDQRPGSIMLTASMSSYIVNTPQPHPAYAVSKASVLHLARSLAGEFVGHNIQVNSISPGIMNTRLSGGAAQADLRRLWLEKSPMGIGDPEDLTGAMILLCSEAGKFITGTDIKIDGKLYSLYDCFYLPLTLDRWLHHVLTSAALEQLDLC